MSKILFLVLVVALVYWVLKAYRKRVDRRGEPPKVTGEDMVRCGHCGVHLPRSESLATSGNFYCSADHQRQHLKSD
ncbi:MAG: PP0621 family protein [Betaproteobacteria bacterium]